MRTSILMMCVMGLIGLFLIGADPVKPTKAPTSLPISLSIQKPVRAPSAGIQGSFAMTLEVKNNSDQAVKISDYVPVDLLEANVKSVDLAVSSDTPMLHVTCRIPKNSGGLQISREHIGFKTVTIEPKKSATLKFDVPGVFFNWEGKYQLQAEVLNKGDFTCPPSAAIEIEVVK